MHERVTTMRHQRVLGAFVAACVGVATMVAGVVGASSASAAIIGKNAQTTVSGSTSVQSTLGTTSLLGVNVESSGLAGTIDWQQLTTLSTQFDSDAVRQGRNVDPLVRASRTTTGTMVANWSLADLMVSFPGYAFPFDIGTIGLSTSGNCNLRFGGAAYVCHLTNDASTILDSSPMPGPYVNAASRSISRSRRRRWRRCGRRRSGECPRAPQTWRWASRRSPIRCRWRAAPAPATTCRTRWARCRRRSRAIPADKEACPCLDHQHASGAPVFFPKKGIECPWPCETRRRSQLSGRERPWVDKSLSMPRSNSAFPLRRSCIRAGKDPAAMAVGTKYQSSETRTETAKIPKAPAPELT